MDGFTSGEKNGFTYGHLFRSAAEEGSIVLDTGGYELPVESAELLIDGYYIPVSNLEAFDEETKITGRKARIKNGSYIYEKSLS